MPLGPTGVYTLPSGFLAVTGQDILPSNHNPPLLDIEAVLSEAFYRTGVAPMLAPLNFNTFKGINLANGTADGDAINKGQMDTAISASVTFTAVGTGRVLKMTNGFKAQIFTVNNVSGFDVVNFPEAFASAVLGIWGNPVFSPPGGLYIGVDCTPINLIGFTAHARSIANGGTVVLATNAITQYLAIGI